MPFRSIGGAVTKFWPGNLGGYKGAQPVDMPLSTVAVARQAVSAPFPVIVNNLGIGPESNPYTLPLQQGGTPVYFSAMIRADSVAPGTPTLTFSNATGVTQVASVTGSDGTQRWRVDGWALSGLTSSFGSALLTPAEAGTYDLALAYMVWTRDPSNPIPYNTVVLQSATGSGGLSASTTITMPSHLGGGRTLFGFAVDPNSHASFSDIGNGSGFSGTGDPLWGGIGLNSSTVDLFTGGVHWSSQPFLITNVNALDDNDVVMTADRSCLWSWIEIEVEVT